MPEEGVGPKEGPDVFEKTHGAIDRNMNTGNDRSKPLGGEKGEQSILGGGRDGGNVRGGENNKAINERNQ